ncbi:YIP1 family protein [Pyxidicoccus parkwayensis]|uniref:YIP1 family protein n=1 Tax=Pyxidicoccus parkwayensis TaxID=2813578 RepID=A0ABX7NSL5_9BACT|nr:Yip1 family protein [Pyxidicoccus parkwaysis]QSQ21867.1 YIP1 family protein [Pyxidicoccus parkwaysis]
MRIPCPYCPAFIIPGAESCGMCGASLLTEAVPGSGDAVCAVHPEYRSLRACGRCGSFACAKCLRQGPGGEIVCAACQERMPMGEVAWDRRQEVGTVRAFWETCMDVMFRPGPTFERLQPGGTVGSSLGFALLCNAVAYFTTALIYMAFMAVFPMPDDTMRSDNVSPAAFRALGVGMFAAMMVIAPIMGVLITLFISAVDHLLLKLVGASEHPYEVTLRGNALSQAPYLLGLIPFCGMYVAPLWGLALRVMAYRSLHSTSWGKAAFGALAAPILFCFVCGGFYAAMIMASSAFSR